jgi:hypothetical protein
MSESEVLIDLKQCNGNKAKLMQKYSDQQREILNRHGGNLSDLPSDPKHPYHHIQDKIATLGRLK